jgi:hypothetical protein
MFEEKILTDIMERRLGSFMQVLEAKFKKKNQDEGPSSGQNPTKRAGAKKKRRKPQFLTPLAPAQKAPHLQTAPHLTPNQTALHRQNQVVLNRKLTTQFY